MPEWSAVWSAAGGDAGTCGKRLCAPGISEIPAPFRYRKDLSRALAHEIAARAGPLRESAAARSVAAKTLARGTGIDTGSHHKCQRAGILGCARAQVEGTSWLCQWLRHGSDVWPYQRSERAIAE